MMDYDWESGGEAPTGRKILAKFEPKLPSFVIILLIFVSKIAIHTKKLRPPLRTEALFILPTVAPQAFANGSPLL